MSIEEFSHQHQISIANAIERKAELLNLSHSTLDHNFAVNLTNFLGSHTFFTSISLDYSQFNDVSTETLTSLFSSHQVTHISLVGVPLIPDITHALKAAENIKSIDLTSCFCKEETSLDLIYELITEQTHITHLNLSMNPLKSIFFEKFFSISNDYPFETLNFSHCAIDEISVQHICDYLQNTTTLLHLNLSHSSESLDDDCIDHIVDALHVNTTLVSLRLTDNDIHTEGGIALGSLVGLKAPKRRKRRDKEEPEEEESEDEPIVLESLDVLDIRRNPLKTRLKQDLLKHWRSAGKDTRGLMMTFYYQQ
ncbi:hypothetical protein PCE1_002686 [Barthelona sp. PCE]